MNLSKQKPTKTTVALVNKTQITVLDQNGSPFVPIKPICDALGIYHQTQINKLKEDEFFSSVVALGATTGADGKTYEMLSLPLKYALLWLGSINPKNVAPEAKESVMRYKEACASALFDYFYGHVLFVRERNRKLFELRQQKAEAKQRFANAKEEIKQIDNAEFEIITTTYDQYRAQNPQTSLDFPAPETEDAPMIEEATDNTAEQ